MGVQIISCGKASFCLPTATELNNYCTKIMGVLCHTCHGSGRLLGGDARYAAHAATACGGCEGRGYRSASRRSDEAVADVEIGKVLAYNHTMGAAIVYLEETIQQGDSLLVVAQGVAIEFAVEAILVAGMKLSMALKGWEVTLLVPQPLQPGAWIMRK